MIYMNGMCYGKTNESFQGSWSFNFCKKIPFDLAS